MTELTAQQTQILRLVADGRSNAEIGQALVIHEDTVKTHLRRIFRALGARDRANAAALVLEVKARRDVYRLVRAKAALDGFQQDRFEAPDGSRFARLYDAVAEALNARVPDLPSRRVS